MWQHAFVTVCHGACQPPRACSSVDPRMRAAGHVKGAPTSCCPPQIITKSPSQLVFARPKLIIFHLQELRTSDKKYCTQGTVSTHALSVSVGCTCLRVLLYKVSAEWQVARNMYLAKQYCVYMATCTWVSHRPPLLAATGWAVT